MLLKRKNVQKLQEGGRVRQAAPISSSNRFASSGLAQAGTSYVPIDIAHEAPIGVFKPPTPTRQGTGYGRRGSGSGSGTPRKQEDGYQSDKAYAANKLGAATAALNAYAARTDVDFESSQAIEKIAQLRGDVNTANTYINSVKEAQTSFKEVISDKTIGRGTKAIDLSNNTAFVINSDTKQKEVINLDDLENDMLKDMADRQYHVLTVADAIHSRVFDQRFSGFTSNGGVLAGMVGNSKSKTAVDEVFTTAFSKIGYTDNKGNILFSINGQQFDPQTMLTYFSQKTDTKTNQPQLEAATSSLLDSIYGTAGLKHALEKEALTLIANGISGEVPVLDENGDVKLNKNGRPIMKKLDTREELNSYKNLYIKKKIHKKFITLLENTTDRTRTFKERRARAEGDGPGGVPKMPHSGYFLYKENYAPGVIDKEVIDEDSKDIKDGSIQQVFQVSEMTLSQDHKALDYQLGDETKGTGTVQGIIYGGKGLDNVLSSTGEPISDIPNSGGITSMVSMDPGRLEIIEDVDTKVNKDGLVVPAKEAPRFYVAMNEWLTKDEGAMFDVLKFNVDTEIAKNDAEIKLAQKENRAPQGIKSSEQIADEEFDKIAKKFIQTSPEDKKSEYNQTYNDIMSGRIFRASYGRDVVWTYVNQEDYWVGVDTKDWDRAKALKWKDATGKESFNQSYYKKQVGEDEFSTISSSATPMIATVIFPLVDDYHLNLLASGGPNTATQGDQALNARMSMDAQNKRKYLDFSGTKASILHFFTTRYGGETGKDFVKEMMPSDK